MAAIILTCSALFLKILPGTRCCIYVVFAQFHYMGQGKIKRIKISFNLIGDSLYPHRECNVSRIHAYWSFREDRFFFHWKIGTLGKSMPTTARLLTSRALGFWVFSLFFPKIRCLKSRTWPSCSLIVCWGIFSWIIAIGMHCLPIVGIILNLNYRGSSLPDEDRPHASTAKNKSTGPFHHLIFPDLPSIPGTPFHLLDLLLK